MTSRALHDHWLSEKRLQTGLSALITLQLLHSALYSRLSKPLFLA
jgi:hypothetical protein